ncbi:MAG: 30S ribosomal protein S4, partial [archaeon]
MGHPRRLRKKYSTPKHPWQKDRIIQENKLVKEFGLKNKREIWIAKALLSKYLRIAKTLIGLSKEERLEKEKVLLNKLEKYGLVKKSAKLDDVLSISIRDVLSRRLQTIVWKKGLASTPKQARQFITHGHITLNGQ